MDSYVFEDALTGSAVACSYPGLDARTLCTSDYAGRSQKPSQRQCETLFFPGCSLLNYGLPLTQAVYDLLRHAGVVEGISLLCCGLILRYEPDGKAIQARHEAKFREHVAALGVKRIVAACPNCVSFLRRALALNEKTAQVQVVALPQVLVDLGYRVDEGVAREMLEAEVRGKTFGAASGEVSGMECAEVSGEASDAALAEASDVSSAAASDMPLLKTFSVHDSCPDRATGEFADGLRALMGPSLTVDPEHNRKHSQCCGSLVRAAGNFALADEQAKTRGEEAVAAGASAIVTACVSCTFQLTMAQYEVPVFHYLELLYNWRIDWAHVDEYMKLRFLFDDPQEQGSDSNPRAFVGLESDGREAQCKREAGNGGEKLHGEE